MEEEGHLRRRAGGGALGGTLRGAVVVDVVVGQQLVHVQLVVLVLVVVLTVILLIVDGANVLPRAGAEWLQSGCRARAQGGGRGGVKERTSAQWVPKGVQGRGRVARTRPRKCAYSDLVAAASAVTAGGSSASAPCLKGGSRRARAPETSPSALGYATCGAGSGWVRCRGQASGTRAAWIDGAVDRCRGRGGVQLGRRGVAWRGAIRACCAARRQSTWAAPSSGILLVSTLGTPSCT